MRCSVKFGNQLTSHHLLTDSFTDSNKNICILNLCYIRDAVIYVLADFVRKGGTPPPTLTENQKKKVFFLSGKGGYPPPLTESPLSFSGKFFPKRAKNDVFFIK